MYETSFRTVQLDSEITRRNKQAITQHTPSRWFVYLLWVTCEWVKNIWLLFRHVQVKQVRTNEDARHHQYAKLEKTIPSKSVNHYRLLLRFTFWLCLKCEIVIIKRFEVQIDWCVLSPRRCTCVLIPEVNTWSLLRVVNTFVNTWC